jgi:hypothetical protein
MQTQAVAATAELDPRDRATKTSVASPADKPDTPAHLRYGVAVGRECQELFGFGKTKQQELINQGEIRSYLIGNRGPRLIIVQSILDYLERQQQREAAGQLGFGSPNPRARNPRRAAIAMAASETTAAAPGPPNNLKKTTCRASRKAESVSRTGR